MVSTYKADYFDEFGQPSELPEVIVEVPGTTPGLNRFRLAPAAEVGTDFQTGKTTVPLQGVWESVQRGLRKSLTDPEKESFSVQVFKESWIPLRREGMNGVIEDVKGLLARPS